MKFGADTPTIAIEVLGRHRAAVVDDAVGRMLAIPPPPGYGGTPPTKEPDGPKE